MNALDWILVVVVLAYALSGYWQGFISGAFATAGLLLGGLLGIWLAPQLLGSAAPAVWVSLGALFVVLVCASVGQAILQYAGGRLRDKVTWQPARALDAVGGAALSAVAVLLVSWALGVAVSGSRIPTVTPLVRSSAVLAQVDEVVPAPVHRGLQAFNDVVGSSFFPRYLEPFAPERIVDVGPPPGRIGRQPGVQAAEQSVLKIRGQNSCGRGVEGTGFLYSPDRLMTNAHVVAGVSDPVVTVGDEELDATVVHYDPAIDVAVLAVDGVRRPFLSFERTAEARQPAAVLGYPNDGPYNVQSARIRGEQRLRSPDIYGNGVVVREVYSLRGLVRPGNSGGPLVNRRGDVVGVIFAASVSDPDTGYALTAEQVASAAANGLGNDSPVSTQGCA
ncbi:MarP family serine protease [Nocardioides massiliensis]|uniref:S1-C subfamily serine protease n=1 Tax=Nocardioides massiliensis TaxID=1325935 RepID=A0ABT9NKN4_9ACTN|nr:MarP family serine protease [Nocardioides massiliensis]MDP9820973.1 S1-C subfamily serine protease [Nocardioides massiliensis]